MKSLFSHLPGFLIFISLLFGRYVLCAQDTGVIRTDTVLSGNSGQEGAVCWGYGMEKKGQLAGAVSFLGEKDFYRGLYASPDQLLQGQFAGVYVLNNSGQPGGSITMRIRGTSSILAGNQPLFVIDGIALDGRSVRPGLNITSHGTRPEANPLNFINIQDIASIEVLKDASTAAIYGARGANGVVLIKTRGEEIREPYIDLSWSTGLSRLLNGYGVLDSKGYRDALNKYDLPSSGDYKADVNAIDAIMRTGISQNYQLSVGNGSEKGSYRFSASYYEQGGIVNETGLKRVTGRINSTHQFLKNDRLRVDFNFLTSHVKEQIKVGPADDYLTNGNLIRGALIWNPTRRLYETDGSPVIYPIYSTVNPVALIDGYDDVAMVTTFLGSMAPTVRILDGLEYQLRLGIHHALGERRAQVKSWINVPGIQDRGWADVSYNTMTTQQATHTLNYRTRLSSTAELSTMMGFEYLKTIFKGVGLSAYDFISDDIDYTQVLQNSSTWSRDFNSFADPDEEWQSFFGRAHVNVKEKYLFTASLRADGASKFGDNNKYGFFPGLGLAWSLSKEPFLQDGPFRQLTLRLGWGKTGNSFFPAGSSLDRYHFNRYGGLFYENIGNPDLKWETTTSINAGFDFILRAPGISGSLEYFRRVTKDLLMVDQVVSPGPFSQFWINLPGEVVNTGMELMLNATLLKRKDLDWELGANVSFQKNELRNYIGPDIRAVFGVVDFVAGNLIQRMENGHPLHTFYTREWNSLDENGVSTYTNGIHSFFYFDHPYPDVLLGIHSTISWRKLGLQLHFNGNFGHEIYNLTASRSLPFSNLYYEWNTLASVLEAAKMENIQNQYYASSRYLEKGDFMKLANVALYYELGSVGKQLKDVRIWLSGQNLLLLTGYSGQDPEVNSIMTDEVYPYGEYYSSMGIDYAGYPSAKSVMIGVDVSF